MSSERDLYFAFPALYGAPAYVRPPKNADEERPFDPDDLPLAAEQSEEESALLRDLGLVGRYQPALAAVAEPPGSGASTSPEPSLRRVSIRAITDRIRPRSS